jgi:hypothetical protein
VGVLLQHRVSSSVLRLQSPEFVLYFLSPQTRPINLGTLLIPNVRGVLTFFEQSFVFGTDRCFDGELLAHAFLPSLMPMHFARQHRQVANFEDFETIDGVVEVGFQYAESDYFPFLVCTFYTPRISSFIACCSARLFYAIEFSAHYQIQRESGGKVASLTAGSETLRGSARSKGKKCAPRNTKSA